jgi:hypothetical protein
MHQRGREREDAEDGRRESKKKMYSAEYAKGASKPSRPTKGMAWMTKGMAACGRGGSTR